MDRQLTLEDAMHVIDASPNLTVDKKKFFCESIESLADLLGGLPGELEADLAALSRRLAGVNPAARNLKPKTVFNRLSRGRAALRATGLFPDMPTSARLPLIPAWESFRVRVMGAKAWEKNPLWLAICQFAGYASARGVLPAQVTDNFLASFWTYIDQNTLRGFRPRQRRELPKAWNAIAAQYPRLGLQPLTVPAPRPLRKSQILSNALSQAFTDDVDEYGGWCGQGDVFAANARPRSVSKRTQIYLRYTLYQCASILIANGVNPQDINGIADLVTEDAVRIIFGERLRVDGPGGSSTTQRIGFVLHQVAADWVKLNEAAMEELRRLKSRLAHFTARMSAKNRTRLRPFNDDAILKRLLRLPDQLWLEVKRDANPDRRTLAKAQAALAIAILTHCPLRLQNLTDLQFGTHIHLMDGVNSTSTLEVMAAEVKNREDQVFDLTPALVKMLSYYRTQLVPAALGRASDFLFVKIDGTQKKTVTVRYLIKTYMRERLGLEFNPHAFRHLAGKLILDAEPGSFELVKQLLGHKSIKTTVDFYTGVDTARAAKHHQRLIEERLEKNKRPAEPRRRKRNNG